MLPTPCTLSFVDITLPVQMWPKKLAEDLLHLLFHYNHLPLKASIMATPIPLLAPLYLPGQEPVPPGTTPEERAEMQQAIKYQKILSGALESCPLKVVMSGGAGESPWHERKRILARYTSGWSGDDREGPCWATASFGDDSASALDCSIALSFHLYQHTSTDII